MSTESEGKAIHHPPKLFLIKGGDVLKKKHPHSCIWTRLWITDFLFMLLLDSNKRRRKVFFFVFYTFCTV